ncbi:unnamed protein product [Paramecium sonneborni]|uniref:3-hydroxyacyl-CoA dehydrogenase type-2 n=1 Tax=Paramecium sonneborni TaxID=65129 RepID=A0A8S1QN80_9CILI|nr:unnamed protein product [Paramecium sonneborni]
MKLDQNTVCLVTGGASGLGLATVLAFLAKGCKVVIADFNQEAGNQILQEQNTPNLKFFKTDVSNEENVIQLIKYTVNEFGAIHIVVNSAGVISAGYLVTPKGTIPVDEMMRVLKINVVGTFNVSKHAAVEMIKQEPQGEFKERGVIINIASLAGIEGQKGQTVYSASKGAVIGMTLPMARDLGKYGIRVMTLAPGVFQTPMGHNLSEKVLAPLRKSAALDRFGQPSEFAESVIGICQCSYLTGEVIRLDGGSRLPNF